MGQSLLQRMLAAIQSAQPDQHRCDRCHRYSANVAHVRRKPGGVRAVHVRKYKPVFLCRDCVYRLLNVTFRPGSMIVEGYLLSDLHAAMGARR